MTDRTLSIRLAVVDGGKVKAELRDIGASGERSLQRIESASRPASRALQALDGVAGQVRGGLEGMAGRLGPLGGGLARLGTAGVAAAAALAGVGLALSRGLSEAAEADRSYRRLEAVLTATGHASGLTGKEIASFAEEIERSTLATAESVQDAASVLATFRSVAGDTFTRALSLAQDLSSVFGQDLSSTATQLGKALEDPIQGISALRRVGVSFTESQRELIRSLVETGQSADAQRVILDALESQVGGAGRAEATGLTGATDRLADAWGNLLESLGRTPAITGTAESALSLLSRGLEGITAWFEDDPIGERIAAAEVRLAEARARLENPGSGIARTVQQTRVADLEAELAALTKIGVAEAEAAANEKARAEAGRLSAEQERRAELLSTQRGELAKTLESLATDPAERIALVNRELAETKRRLDSLRAADGGNAGDVDSAVVQAEEIARRKIASIRGASAGRDGSDAAERAFVANKKVIDDLARRLATFGDERQQFIDQALGRLSGEATGEQRAEVERLATALYDEKLAREQLADAMQAEERLRQEGARLMEATRTPAEELAATIARLDELMRAGAIDAETHGRALADAYATAEAAADRALDASREWQDGVTRALRGYAEEATDAASAAEQVTTKAFQTMEDALVQFVDTGKLDFQSLVDSITADLTRLAVRQSITGPLAALLAGGGAGAAGGPAAGSTEAGALGGLGTLLAGLFHEGGVVGASSEPRRAVDPALFLTAPRYHAGGVAGLMPDEIPAILKRGETVLTPRQTSAARGQLERRNETSAPVTVIMNITTPDAGGFRKSQGQIAAEAARAIERARRNL